MIQVSVIIPTFNRCNTLGRAIASVLQQKNVSFELIIIDDGSTDETNETYSNNPQLRYFYTENSGVSAARNLGIQHSQGEWIAFLDSDDEWLSGKLETQVNFFEQHPDCFIAQTEEIWIRNGVRVNAMNKHKKQGGFIFEKCLPLCAVSPSAVMIHRSLFEEVGVFDESLPACEDYDLWLRISHLYKIGLIEKPLIKKYGGHEDQLSRKYAAMDKFRIYALCKLLNENVLNDSHKAAAIKILLDKYSIYKAGAEKRGNTEELDELRQLVEPILNESNIPDREALL